MLKEEPFTELIQALKAARSWPIAYDVALDDGSFSEKYRISRLPTVFVVDQQGKVAKSASGRISRAELERWLTELGAPRVN